MEMHFAEQSCWSWVCCGLWFRNTKFFWLSSAPVVLLAGGTILGRSCLLCALLQTSIAPCVCDPTISRCSLFNHHWAPYLSKITPLEKGLGSINKQTLSRYKYTWCRHHSKPTGVFWGEQNDLVTIEHLAKKSSAGFCFAQTQWEKDLLQTVQNGLKSMKELVSIQDGKRKKGTFAK